MPANTSQTGIIVVGSPVNGKLLPVGAEQALQRPRVFATSTILGGAEAHSPIAPPKVTPKVTPKKPSSYTTRAQAMVTRIQGPVVVFGSSVYRV